MKAGDEIKYNSHEETVEKNRVELIRTLTCDGTCIYAASTSLAPYHIKLKTSPPHGQLDMFYWENDYSLCFHASALIGWFRKKYVSIFLFECINKCRREMLATKGCKK